jgi:hypothetical protein
MKQYKIELRSPTSNLFTTVVLDLHQIDIAAPVAMAGL